MGISAAPANSIAYMRASETKPRLSSARSRLPGHNAEKWITRKHEAIFVDNPNRQSNRKFIFVKSIHRAKEHTHAHTRVAVQRTVGRRVRQQRDNGETDRRQTPNWTPLGLENVEADLARLRNGKTGKKTQEQRRPSETNCKLEYHTVIEFTALPQQSKRCIRIPSNARWDGIFSSQTPRWAVRAGNYSEC